jgi:hypothetical protein
MKPWFEKELTDADIIKFPEPEAKVVQMPNVQEYPNFITGVQDLQAKQKDGAISQESYDKLYAELIHRFMKKESFETPWYLREAKKDPLVNGSNKGTYLETLLGAAVTARFKAGDTIGPEHVREVMKGLKDENLTAEYNITTVDKVPDKLIFATKIKSKSSKTILDILDHNNLDIMAPYVEQSANVANTEQIITDVTNAIFNNKQKDILYIEAVGAEAQKDTKIDVGIRSIDAQGKETRYRSVSLKKVDRDKEKLVLHNTELKTVEQITQLFETLLGIDINAAPIKKKMEVTKDEAFEPMPIIFEFAGKVLNQQLKNDIDKNEFTFVKRFKDFVNETMRRKDDKVLLVVVSKTDFSVLDFNVFVKNLDDIDLQVRYQMNGKRPQIIFSGHNKQTKQTNDLIELRYTYGSNGRHRLFIEATHAFKELSSVKKGTQTQPKTQPKTTPTTPGAKPQTAPQQKVATGNDGQRYTHYGLQWINQETGKIATRDVAAYLDQNTHLQTPVSA